MKRRIKLEWYHSTDFDRILYYSGALTGVAYFDAYFDRPVFDEKVEVVTDGDGKESIQSMLIEQRMRFVVADVMDNSLTILKMLKIHDTVQITFLDTSTTETVEDFQVSNIDEQGYCFNKITCTYRRTIKTLTKCDNDYTISL